MGLLGGLIPTGRQAAISISDGQYIDTSTSFWGLSEKKCSAKLANGIISGMRCPGRDVLINCLLYDAASSGKPVIYVTESVPNSARGKFWSEVSSGILGSNAIVLNQASPQQGINLFNGMTLSELTEFLISLMQAWQVRINDDMFMFAEGYLDHIYSVLRIRKKKFRLTDMNQYTYDWLMSQYADLLQTRRITQIEYAESTSAIKDLRTLYRIQYNSFQRFCREISQSKLGRIFSGTNTLKQVYKNGKVVLLSLDFNTQGADLFFQLLLKRLRAVEDVMDNSAVCMFEECAVKSFPSEFMKLLSVVKAKANGSVYFTESFMTWWNKPDTHSKEHPASYCNSFFVFPQNVPEDKLYWSAISGAIKKLEATQNVAPMAAAYHMHPSLTRFFCGSWMVHAGTTYAEVDSFNVDQQEIDRLDASSCISIIKMENGIYNRRVSWT